MDLMPTTDTAPTADRPARIPADAGRVGLPPWVAAAVPVVGLLAVVAAALVTGIAAPDQLSDPGALTRWGVPVSEFLASLSMTVTIAAVIFAAGVLPPEVGRRRRRRPGARAAQERHERDEHPAFTLTMTIAAAGAAVWTLSSLAVAVLSYSHLAGVPVSAGEQFTAGLMAYAQQISVGRAWFATAAIAAVVTSLAVAVRGHAGLFWTGIVAMLGIVPQALIGHAAGGDDHYGAVNSIGLHLLGVIVWVGGLLVLVLISGRLVGEDGAQGTHSAYRQGRAPLLATVLSRYSVLAGLGLVTVVASGVVNATIRMNRVEQLFSEYGLLVLAKAAVSLMLGFLGLLHRRWIIPQLRGAADTAGEREELESPRPARRLLWQLIAVEALLMGAVLGASAVLSRTAPPVPEELAPDATPARILTGYELPPELTFERWFTQWRFDWLWVAVALFLALWYLGAVRRLRRRGDPWPVLRTLCWLAGLVVLTWATSGAPAVYGMVLFSAHMVGHMTLTMIAPVFLVLGAPITLALRSLPVRTDGTRGPREWILWIVHSPWGAFVTHPIVAGVNFAGSILVFYYTDFFRFALDEHVGHELMNAHFLLTGFVFALVMIGADPLPRRPPYPLRLVLLLATMVQHAFIGVAMTSSTGLMQASWFGNLGRDWGPDPLADQRIGGAIMWGIGEFPTVLMAVTVAVLWARDDSKRAARLDRQADRDGDAELAAWNSMYDQLNQEDPRVRR